MSEHSHGIQSTSDGMDLHDLHSESYIFGGSPRASALSNFRPFCSYQTMQQGGHSTRRGKGSDEVARNSRVKQLWMHRFSSVETKMRVLADWVDTY